MMGLETIRLGGTDFVKVGVISYTHSRCGLFDSKE